MDSTLTLVPAYRLGTDPSGVDGRDAGNVFLGQRFACTRVDVVGHSMGGLVTRWFVSKLAADAGDNPDLNDLITRGPFNWHGIVALRHAPMVSGDDYCWAYQRPDNWQGGDIRRFIMIGSPFDGTAVAKFMEPAFRPSTPVPQNNDAAGELWSLFLFTNENPQDNVKKGIREQLRAQLFPSQLPTASGYVPPTCLPDLMDGAVVLRMMSDYDYDSFQGGVDTVKRIAIFPRGRSSVRAFCLSGHIPAFQSAFNTVQSLGAGMTNFAQTLMLATNPIGGLWTPWSTNAVPLVTLPPGVAPLLAWADTSDLAVPLSSAEAHAIRPPPGCPWEDQKAYRRFAGIAHLAMPGATGETSSRDIAAFSGRLLGSVSTDQTWPAIPGSTVPASTVVRFHPLWPKEGEWNGAEDPADSCKGTAP